MRADEHAKSLMEKDMTSVWKGIKKNYNSRVNSVESSKSKGFVERKLASIADSSIVFTTVDIFQGT